MVSPRFRWADIHVARVSVCARWKTTCVCVWDPFGFKDGSKSNLSFALISVGSDETLQGLTFHHMSQSDCI